MSSSSMRGYLLRKGSHLDGKSNTRLRLFSPSGGKQSRFLLLKGSSLHSFENEVMEQLEGTHELLGAVVFENLDSAKESMTVKMAEGEVFKLYCKTHEELVKWLEALQACTSLPAEPWEGHGDTTTTASASTGVPVAGRKKRAPSVSMRAEKRVMDAAMKTKKGRAKLKAHIPEDTPARRVLDAVVEFAGQESGPEKATELETSVLKLLIKFLVLHRHDLLDPDSLSAGLPAVVDLCRHIATATSRERVPGDGGKGKESAEAGDYGELLQSMDGFRRVCARVLSPHVTNATLSKMGGVFEYIGEPSRVKRLMEGDGEGERKCRESINRSVIGVLPELEAQLGAPNPAEDPRPCAQAPTVAKTNTPTKAPSKAMRLLGLGSVADEAEASEQASAAPKGRARGATLTEFLRGDAPADDDTAGDGDTTTTTTTQGGKE